MGTKDRKEREREEHKELILNASEQIMISEGLDNLSIRKIAKKIEYSPAIIYHYFKDKDEIINSLMAKGYKRILSTLDSINLSDKNPKEKLEEGFKNYIFASLNDPLEYKTILLSSSPSILEHTSVLFKGAAQKREAIGILVQILRDIYRESPKDESYIELTAQVLWASVFGLIIRIITEENLTEDQKNKLVEHQLSILIKGIMP